MAKGKQKLPPSFLANIQKQKAKSAKAKGGKTMPPAPKKK